MSIPKDAKIIRGHNHIIQGITEWHCAGCGATGDQDTIDFVTIKDSPVEQNKIVEYCCPVCFEDKYLYIVTEQEED